MPKYNIDSVIRMLEQQVRYNNIFEGLYKPQRQVVAAALQHNGRIAAMCSRQSGKSYAICSYLVYKAVTTARANLLFLGLTDQSARDVGIRSILEICDKYRIKYDFKITLNEFHFENGSIIKCAGGNGPPRITNKYRGPGYDGVVIDEAGHYDVDNLDYLYYEVVEPALMRCNGTCVMVSTPSSTEAGLYWKATTQQLPAWLFCRWTTEQNISLAKQYKEALARKVAENPGVDIYSIPKIRREWLGEYARDSQEFVFVPWNYIDSWSPAFPAKYVLGIDIGTRDPTAFVVTATQQFDRNLYITESHIESELYLDGIANKINYYVEKYCDISVVIDTAGAGGPIIADALRKRFSVAIRAANKIKSVNEQIEIINTEAHLNHIKCVSDTNNALIDEAKKLPWKTRANGTKEPDGSYANHGLDALRYAFTEQYPYIIDDIVIVTKEEEMWDLDEQARQEDDQLSW